MKKINCGGFYINEDNFEITDDGELKLKSGGSSGGGGVAYVELTEEENLTRIKLTSTKTCAELLDEDVIIFYLQTSKNTAYFLCVNKVVPTEQGNSPYLFVMTYMNGSEPYITLKCSNTGDFPMATIEQE